jgi:CheY-like chemotaxis protein
MPRTFGESRKTRRPAGKGRSKDGGIGEFEREQTMNNRQPIIVVVDPDVDRSTALSSRLDRRGYHVVRRSSGIDALECVAECRPDLVLSEAALLDLDCPELLHSIRRISPSTQVRFITRQGGSPQLSEVTALHIPAESVAWGVADEVVLAVDLLLERMPFQEHPSPA